MTKLTPEEWLRVIINLFLIGVAVYMFFQYLKVRKARIKKEKEEKDKPKYDF